MRIAVAGGTGVVGRHVVDVARAAGHEPIVISRSEGVDLHDESKVEAALRGADAVVDVANAIMVSGKKNAAFFTEVTGRLSRAGAAAGASRLVVLSIVGIDRVPGYPYYRAKVAQEEAARSGPLPLTIVRATQFHEFPGQILSRLKLGPLGVMPVMRVQPIAARSVAEFIVQTIDEPPSPDPREIAGPEPDDLVRLARAVLRRNGSTKKIVPLAIPGSTGKAMRGGALLPGPDAQLLGPRFDDWLADPQVETGH